MISYLLLKNLVNNYYDRKYPLTRQIGYEYNGNNTLSDSHMLYELKLISDTNLIIIHHIIYVIDWILYIGSCQPWSWEDQENDAVIICQRFNYKKFTILFGLSLFAA